MGEEAKTLDYKTALLQSMYREIKTEGEGEIMIGINVWQMTRLALIFKFSPYMHVRSSTGSYFEVPVLSFFSISGFLILVSVQIKFEVSLFQKLTGKKGQIG